ncbi:MAG: NAD(P)H-binding protein [Pseudomonadota bacterium]
MARVFLAGASGYIGQFVARELSRRGYEVVCFLREGSQISGEYPGVEFRLGSICQPGQLHRDGFRGERFEYVVSCLGSRTGALEDAWDVEYRANRALLAEAKQAGAHQFVLLSALCVQRPKLAFQKAKLAFESALKESGVGYSIVRPTAYFKSLAGQVERVKAGRPFLVFGNGLRTSCKPISERDLARFIVDCLGDASKLNRVLPIGGPGDAITPREQGELLFELCGRPARFRQVPFKLFSVMEAALSALVPLIPSLEDKRELLRIGRYYASHSMLCWDPDRAHYDAALTPSYGSDTLADFYQRIVADGMRGQELGEHALFAKL